MIPYGKQWIDDDDISAVVDTLSSDFLTQGPKVAEFEQKICDITGAQFAVAVSNATAGLHIAILAANLPEGSEVITTPNTFLSSANVIEMAGLTTVLADINPDSGLIDCASVKAAITSKTKAIIPVHFSGESCDLETLQSLAKEHDLIIIEDAAHAIGSGYKSSTIGDSTYSDMTVFSFHPVKTIAMGEGGVVTTNTKDVYDQLCALRSHGVVRDPSQLELSSPGPWYYEMQMLGYNYRITDMQCALGISQLKKLDQFKQRRTEIRKQYDAAFSSPTIKMLDTDPKNDTCFHLATALIDFNGIGKDRATVMTELREQGVGTQVHYIPIYAHPYYSHKYGWDTSNFPGSENYYSRCLSLPLYPKMTDSDVSKVISTVKTVIGQI
jgi:UDP-4-amino-4,6-dideoxy-N-acetyl-beta-L-altrosamine transaminase